LSGLVVDASIGLKWYLDETHASVARLLLNGRDELSVPHLFFTEIGNVLWRRWRRKQLSARVVVATLEAIETVRLTVWEDRSLLWDAMAIALRRGCSVYDSLYLALADRIDGRLVTADRRLVNALAGTDAAGRIVWVEDLARGESPPRH
jgi:predicted nucleic acid-binding protein